MMLGWVVPLCLVPLVVGALPYKDLSDWVIVRRGSTAVVPEASGECHLADAYVDEPAPGVVELTKGGGTEYTVPVDTPVGAYQMVCTQVGGVAATLKNLVIVLFNPENEQDPAYVKSEEARQEYVYRDYGAIWVGSSNSRTPRGWVFGQFEAVSLKTAIYLLHEKQGLTAQERKEPHLVARFFSGLVNSNDGDGGILTGRWQEPYTDGTSPGVWTHSTQILKKFWETKQSVKYGQCWVFAGVLTTMLRTLGLAARPITTFDSAHDRRSQTGPAYDTQVDYFLTAENKVDRDLSDSLWNFHVWVEVYCQRPDLDAGVYDGWQVVDATPQEASPDSEKMECGPAPVAAIKERKEVSYDTMFVVGEVSAGIRYWIHRSSPSAPQSCQVHKKLTDYCQLSSKPNVAGSHVITKKRGRDISPNEIRAAYKSMEEPLVDLEALSELPVVFKVEPQRPFILGEPLRVSVVIRSQSHSTVQVRIQAKLVANEYTKRVGANKDLEEMIHEGTLLPRQKMTVDFVVEEDKYRDVLSWTTDFDFEIAARVMPMKQNKLVPSRTHSAVGGAVAGSFLGYGLSNFFPDKKPVLFVGAGAAAGAATYFFSWQNEDKAELSHEYLFTETVDAILSTTEVLKVDQASNTITVVVMNPLEIPLTQVTIRILSESVELEGPAILSSDSVSELSVEPNASVEVTTDGQPITLPDPIEPGEKWTTQLSITAHLGVVSVVVSSAEIRPVDAIVIVGGDDESESDIEK